MAAGRKPLSAEANGTVVQGPNSLPAAGATAYVYLHGTTTQVTVYATETGSTTLSQPITANTNGQLPGWVVAEQDLDIVASWAGGTSAPAEVVPVRAEDLVGTDPGTGQPAVGSGSVPLAVSVALVSSGSGNLLPFLFMPAPSGDTSGATDTTKANALLTGNGTLALLAGTYWTTGLVTPSNTMIIGAGQDTTTIKLANATNPGQVVGNAGAVTNVTLTNFTIDGNKANQTTNGSGVGYASGTKIKCERLKIINTFAPGVSLFTSTDSSVSGCEFEGCGSSSGQPSISGYGGNRNRIVGNRISTSGGSGIDVGGGGQNCTISANNINGGGFIGIAGGSGSGHSITGNTINGTTDNGIDLGSCTNVTVSGNTITGCGEGIVWNGSTAAALALTITGNTIDGTTGTDASHSGIGIAVLAGGGVIATDVTISGNTTLNCYAQGIMVNAINDSSITGNTVLNSGLTNSNAGIDVQNTSGGGVGITVTGNRVKGTAGASGYGLRLMSGVSCTVAGNDFTGNTAGSINNLTTRGTVRGNTSYNPVGVVTPAVPLTTVAVAAVNYDRTFYVTTAAGGCTMTIQSGPAVVIPASSFGTVRVPAGQTVTPTDTNAPTWLVEGE